MAVTGLRCEYLSDPLGLDVEHPRLSWRLPGTGRAQSAYQVVVAGAPGKLATEPDLWDSGQVTSESTQVEYGGAPLAAGADAFWRVRIWDDEGAPSAWSATARWSQGLGSSDWKAAWITIPPQPFERDDFRPSPYLRRQFPVRKRLRRARLYITALGLYRAFVNGARVGDDHLRPGWTDYSQRLQYQVYDVTTALRQGENVLGVILAEGWYSGHFGIDARRGKYGTRPELLAQLAIEYTDGDADLVISDGSWRGSIGAYLAADLLQGEVYDARREPAGWAATGFDDSGWNEVASRDRAAVPELVAQRNEPVRAVMEVRPVRVESPVFDNWVFDLGQNLVGHVRLLVEGPAGTEVLIQHGEALAPDGTVYTANLRHALQRDRYILKGQGPEVYEPAFTFHGFRYVQVTNFPGTPGPEAVTGIVCHSDLPAAGHFECSNTMVNQLWSNALWSQRGNYLEVPTDCPQRNERLGWLGDARIFSRTGLYNFDASAFFTKWLDDVRLARTADGNYPDFAPWIAPGYDGGPGWSDAGVFIPWVVHEVTGDTRVIEENFEAMCGFVDLLVSANPDLLRVHRGGVNWGDWLSLPEDGESGRCEPPLIPTVFSTTPKDVFATAFLARSAELLSRMAAAVGHTSEAASYGDLARRVREAFVAAFVDGEGRIKGDTQTAYALALEFELLPEELRAAAGQHLVAAVHRFGDRMNTGITGTELILPALTRAGELELAYKLLLSEEFPSWGFSIKHGATTIWERWDGWTPEGGFQDIRMNSLNHYALGAVGAWLYSAIAGIAQVPGSVGFRRLLIQPRPGGGLTWAKASYRSAAGDVESSWRVDGNAFELDVTVPPGASARVVLPNGEEHEAGPGRHQFSAALS